jgi:hypothetical protein
MLCNEIEMKSEVTLEMYYMNECRKIDAEAGK